ncbi:MAG: hypothetical protein ACE5IQ_14505 [Candidatus Methylomirabilales bacterium]
MDHTRSGQLLYEQPKEAFIKKKYPVSALIVIGLSAGITAVVIVAMPEISNLDPGLGQLAIMGVLGFAVLVFFLLTYRELARVRFGVFQEGFRPPFATLGQFFARQTPFVSFSNVRKAKQTHWLKKGETRLDTVSFELDDGSRIVVEADDVGLEGLRSLVEAFDAYRSRADRGVVTRPPRQVFPKAPDVPRWIRREMWQQIGLSLLVVALIALALSLYFVLPAPSELPWRYLVSLALLSVAVPMVLLVAYRSWKRAKQHTRERLGEPDGRVAAEDET